MSASAEPESPRPMWVPSTDDDLSDHAYPVIYMHDGQNLFTGALAFGQGWQVDEHLERLSGLGLDAIVVGMRTVPTAASTSTRLALSPSGASGAGESVG